MDRRTRLALFLAIPVLLVVLVAVHALWYAYIQTLNEGDRHRVADHITVVLVWLWGSSAVIAGAITWAVAGRLARRAKTI